MRTLLLICISAALGAVAIASVDNPELLRRLEKNGRSLNRLVARAVSLADTVSRRKNEREQAELDAQNMLQRIEGRNGGICNGNEFVCGGAAGQCVDNLVVCDGKKDCDNGADEADAVCKPPAKVGDVWKGRFVYHTCSVHLFGDLKFVLHDFKKKEDMKSLADVSATLFWDDKSDPDAKFTDSLPYNGVYKFYSRTAQFLIKYAGNIYKELFYFVPGDGDILHYDVLFANSGEICARAYLHKQ